MKIKDNRQRWYSTIGDLVSGDCFKLMDYPQSCNQVYIKINPITTIEIQSPCPGECFAVRLTDGILTSYFHDTPVEILTTELHITEEREK